MKNNLITLIKAWFAGILISIGCNVYLSCDNQYCGAILFSIGLITILLFGFNLYTGKVGYIIQEPPNFIKQVLIILLGNIIGCVCMGIIFPSDIATNICNVKLQMSIGETLCRSIMCGLLMFIAVDAYKSHNTLLATIFCVPTFILSGYEHSIADVTYFVMGRMPILAAMGFISIVIVGNAIGGMLLPIGDKVLNCLTKGED